MHAKLMPTHAHAAFVLEGTTPWELPEALLGALRLNRLDLTLAKTVSAWGAWQATVQDVGIAYLITVLFYYCQKRMCDMKGISLYSHKGCGFNNPGKDSACMEVAVTDCKAKLSIPGLFHQC